MKNIDVYLDRHFPYDIPSLNQQNIRAIKVNPNSRLPLPLARIAHVFDLYAKSFKGDVILGNRRTALMLGLLYRIYKPRKVSLIGYEIIFNFKVNFRNKLVKFIWRQAVKMIDKLVVMTDSERAYLSREFHTTSERFRTINFYAENAEYLGPNEKGYIFSAGRMERDFETLIRAVKDTKYPTIIVAGEDQKEKLEAIRPPHVKILYNIPKEYYLELLRESKMVVVPLYNGSASRGQVVILEAMKYGKPVVCSKVAGTATYLQDGKDGIFVEPGNPEAMKKVFEQYFEDLDVLKRMGQEAYKSQQTNYSPEVFYRNYRNLIRDMYAQNNETYEAKAEEIESSAVRPRPQRADTVRL